MITEYLYGAYGSNMNMDQMAYRCPDAEPAGTILLKDHKLVFRGVADIAMQEQAHVPIGLWRITERCEKALDKYEGFPNLYGKIYQQTDEGLVMLYTMNRPQIYPPTNGYLSSIIMGYEDFMADYTYLEEAVAHSYTHETTRTRGYYQ